MCVYMSIIYGLGYDTEHNVQELYLSLASRNNYFLPDEGKTEVGIKTFRLRLFIAYVSSVALQYTVFMLYQVHHGTHFDKCSNRLCRSRGHYPYPAPPYARPRGNPS